MRIPNQDEENMFVKFRGLLQQASDLSWHIITVSAVISVLLISSPAKGDSASWSSPVDLSALGSSPDVRGVVA